jgi:oligopeptide transport system substrate-binding protein
VTKGGQEPAQWFCRPGMAGCPTMDSHPDAGIKSDPDAAQADLQVYLDEMGYSSVDEIPEIILMYFTAEGDKHIAEAIAEMWKETLGIDVTITTQEFKAYLMMLQTEGATPHVWRLGWCMDYPDANNWTRDVFACGGFESIPTAWCNELFTAMLEEAALEPDPIKRQDMYAEAETILCYEDAVIAPILWGTTVMVSKPYVHGPLSTAAWEKFSLDLELE